jgi:ABC-2 type transport system ATP-binding protein
MTDERAIEVQGLVREFKGGVRAVDGIDLHVATGEIYGFLGPNGAGKSTTVKVLTTLLPPTSGRATVAGYDVAKEGAKVRAAIGVALQDVALDPMLTGREHMRLQGGLQGIPRAERGRRGDDLLERVGLSDAADRRSSTYSGGMRRRLDLALALLHHPRILFLDEPTTGLDVQSRTALWDEVERLAREEGTTVFLTTQYLEEADVLANRVGIIDRGTIVAEGTPAALKAQVAKPTVEIIPRDSDECAAASAALAPFGEPAPPRVAGSVAVRLDSGADQLAAIVRALDTANVSVANLALHEPTLDDVFLAKTGRSLEGAAEAPPPEESVAPDRARPEPAPA